MSLSDVLAAATLVSVLLGIGIILFKGASSLRKKDNDAAVASHELKEAVQSMKDCKTNIKSVSGIVEGINRVVVSIDKNGSEGANKQFMEINKKLDNHRIRLVRIEAHVNGGLDKVPADEL
jgi:hypothetical protein